MSIRQIRLNLPEQIKSRIGEFKGKKVNVVFHDRTSMLGVVTQIEADGFVMENGRQKKERYSFNDVSELYFDQVI